MAVFSAFIVGLIFAIGLGVGGMTQPGRVVGFLDIFGNWNPSLLLVMVGALLIHKVLYRVIRRRSAPLFSDMFRVPSRRDINIRLFAGATLFGLGWGLAGFCPAPAITALASLQMTPFIFVISMVAGMLIFNVSQRPKTAEK